MYAVSELVKDAGSASAVAVYGTLRESQHNHFLLNECVLKNTVELCGYAMYVMSGTSYDAIPFIVPTGKPEDKVTVEVYLPERNWQETVTQLDWLEGSPEWYQRKVVQIDNRPTFVYVMNEVSAAAYLADGCRRIPTGDWFNPEVKEEAA
jgi:gamma-glutamylcyclotransferase (GGCT)/AIG2-like uncharacterized protein YtfP